MVFQLVLSNLVVCVLSSAQLDIHIFNVGQADSQLIVFPSGYSILIDAGETSSGSMNCKKIAERVKSILGHTRVDVGVVTHLHQDHVGVPYKSGFWYLIEHERWYSRLCHRRMISLAYSGNNIINSNKSG
ncbi:hypothetical protein EIN_153550, partial [Entamoeba invadens IP1]